MGILNALSTAVTGLSVQSYALENISGNIANSQTVGFKRVDTSFVDLIPDSPARHEVAGSVAAYSQLTTTIQGQLKTTGVATNIAVNGDGYFTVQENKGSNSAPVFGGQNLYTRRGDFTAGAGGYLVNGTGKYLVGTVEGQGAGPIKIPTTAIPAKQTSGITYQANLPTYPKTANSDSTIAGSELLSSSVPSTTDGSITGAKSADFLKQSIAGSQVTVYNTAGTPVTLQTRWAKTDSSTLGGTHADTWALYYQQDSNAGSTATAFAKVADFTFTAAGALASSTPLGGTASTSPAPSIAVPAMVINGTSMGAVHIDFASGSLTQFSDSSGQLSNGAIQQDGYTTGTLNNLSISSDGSIIGNYSNGKVEKLAQVQVAHFNATDSLKRMDGGTYAQTIESGEPTFGLLGSTLTGGSLEMSNTDISDEFSKMIISQQAYSANTRVLSTAQQMLQDIINVIR